MSLLDLDKIFPKGPRMPAPKPGAIRNNPPAIYNGTGWEAVAPQPLTDDDLDDAAAEDAGTRELVGMAARRFTAYSHATSSSGVGQAALWLDRFAEQTAPVPETIVAACRALLGDTEPAPFRPISGDRLAIRKVALRAAAASLAADSRSTDVVLARAVAFEAWLLGEGAA